MKFIIIFFLIIILQSCSFDNKSGIWSNVSEPIKKQNSAFKDFKSFSTIKEKIFQKQKPLDKNFTFNILNGKIITEWKDEFLSESNLKENFVYKNTNQNYSKSRKVSRSKLNNDLLYENNIAIFTDIKGNIITYSLKDKSNLKKFNFYKKRFKYIKKDLNIVVEEGTIFVSDNIGYLYAYNHKSDKILWAKKFKVPFRSNIKFKDQKIFTADQNNNLFIINATNGEIIKQIPTEEMLVKNNYKNNIAINNDNLFFLNTFGSIYSLNLTTLKVNWFLNINSTLSTDLSNLFFAKPIKIFKDKLIIMTNKNLQVLDSRTGLNIFKLPIKAQTETIINNDYIFFVTKDNLLISLDLNTGYVIYSKNIGEEIIKNMNLKKNKLKIKFIDFVNSQIYLYLENSKIVKLDVYGQIRNIQKLPKKIYSRPIFINSKILYISDKNQIVILG